MFIRRAGKLIVQLFQMQGGEVAVAVKCVEMRTEGSASPVFLVWSACAFTFWRWFYTHDIEVTAHRGKRLVFEQRLCCYSGIVDEILHLPSLVTFCHESDAYAVCGVVGLLKCEYRIFRFYDFTYKYVFWVHWMSEGRAYLSVEVEEFNLHIYRRFRERNEKHVFERLWCGLRLIARQPLLE